MKRIFFLLPALLLLAMACKQKPKETPGTQQAAQDSATNFLPVADLIRNDITQVDKFAGGILRKRNINGKKDSTYIRLPEFHQLASQFILPELDSASFQAHFKEHSLMDETTNMVNFIYTLKQPGWPLKSVMVYLLPTVQTDQVKRVYMEREFSSGDTAISQKLTWKMQEYFYIITLRQPKSGPAVTSVDKVIWDPQQFAE